MDNVSHEPSTPWIYLLLLVSDPLDCESWKMYHCDYRNQHRCNTFSSFVQAFADYISKLCSQLLHCMSKSYSVLGESKSCKGWEGMVLLLPIIDLLLLWTEHGHAASHCLSWAVPILIWKVFERRLQKFSKEPGHFAGNLDAYKIPSLRLYPQRHIGTITERHKQSSRELAIWL